MINGWYRTWLYDPEESIRNIHHGLNPASVYHQWFVHREEDEVETIIDYFVNQYREGIAAGEENKGVIRAKAEYKKGLDRKERRSCEAAAQDSIAALEKRIGIWKEWVDHWNFFRPSNAHFRYTHTDGKAYSFHLRTFHNPLEIE